MAVKLRLKRMGAKKKPFYRIVAADERSPRDGRSIETIGTYNPLTSPVEIKIDQELALKWLSLGAKPTDTVRDLLSKVGVMKAYHESKPAKKKKAKVEKKPTTAKKTTKATPAKKAPAKKAATKTTTKTTAKKATTKKESK